METNITVIESGNAITLNNQYSVYEAVRSNPFFANIINKSDSTITRHLHELKLFGIFLFDEKGIGTDETIVIDGKETTERKPCSMQQARHWYGITAGDIEDYKYFLTYVRGLRTTTISQSVYIIKSYARVAYDAGAISIEDLTKIEHIKGFSGSEADNIDDHRQKTADRNRHNIGGNVTTLTKRQVTMLKFNHPETLQGKRDSLLFCILLDHGLRISDAIALTTNSIDMEQQIITVTTKKTGAFLRLQMTADVYDAFMEYFKLYQPESGCSIWTGVNKHGTAQGTWGKHSAQMEISKVAESFGISNLSAHDLRHCWTDRAIDGGSDLVAVQQAGGWKSIQMVSRYATKKAVSNSGVVLS